MNLEFVRPMATLCLCNVVPTNFDSSVWKTLTDDGGCGGSVFILVRVPMYDIENHSLKPMKKACERELASVT